MKVNSCVPWIIFLHYVMATAVIAEDDCFMWSLCSSEEAEGGCIVDCRHNYYKEVPHNVPPHTLSLDLSENEIPRIGEGDFSQLTVLETLDLTQNLIKNIEQNTFCKQEALQNLNLSNNKLEDITKALFSYLVNLKALNLSNNQLKELQVHDLRNNSKLEFLDLSKNAFTTPQTSVTRHLYKLRRLYLSHNQIKEIHSSTFRNFPRLQVLNLSGNMITKLVGDIFSEQKFLQKLYLSENHIEDMQDQTFGNLLNLEELHLCQNRLKEIHRETFRNLSKLTSLHLSQNRLEEIHKETFRNLSKLTSLDLSGNQIQALLEHTFHNLSNLQNLDLSGNQIQTLLEHTFHNLRNLQNLDISQNQLINIHESSFRMLNGLKNLLLSQNALKKLPRNLLTSLANLNHLDISHNTLTQLYEDTFCGLSKLKHLILTGNLIMDLPQNVFGPLKNLEELYLDDNQIEEIHSDALRHVKDVTLLDFSRNSLTDLREGSMKHLHKLEKLHVDENKISNIEESTFETFFSLGELYLSSNRILGFKKYLFWPLGMLNYLDLSENQISKIWKHSFYNLSSLETLRLNGNQIKSLHRDTFKNLQNLRIIYLNDNRLKSLREGTLMNLSNLFDIYLTRNHLEELETGSIQSVPNLHSMDLSFNRLSNEALETFFSNLTLQYLDLSNNNLSMVSKDLLHLKEDAILFFVSIANNGITSLPEDLFSLISLDGVLDMSGNDITELPPLVFSFIKLPQELDTLLLHRNKLSFIPKDAFQGLHSLKSLSLFHNRIKLLADGAFSKTSVMFIYLFGNELSTMSNASFDNGNITEIHLYGNPGLRLYRSGFSGLNSSTTIYVGCDSVQEIQRTMTVLTCITPNYVPTLEIEEDVVLSLQNEGFTCDKNDKYIHSSSYECKPCPRGHFGSDNIQCLPCPAGGYFQDEIGAIPNILGELNCKECPQGMYVNHSGATSIAECKICPDGTNKSQFAGFRACACLDNFARYDRFGPCIVCPDDGYNCSGGDYVSLNPGFFWSWNFSSANISSYKRFVDNLNNETRFFSNASSDTTYSLEIPQVFKCPRFNSCSNAPGALEVTCSKGYRGWLCSKCDRGFFGVMGSCFPCPGSLYLVIEVIVGLAVVAGILCIVRKQYKRAENINSRRSVFDIMISRGKIALGFYQVIGEFLISIHEISWVGNLYIVGEIFSILEMNILLLFVKPRCLNESLVINPKSEFIIGMTFLCLSILVPYVVLKIKEAYFKYKHPSLEGSEITFMYYHNLKEKIWGFVVVLLFLTYPPICTSIFRLYPRACQTFCLDSKKAHCIELLRSDFDINCKELALYHISAYIATIGYVIAFPTLLFFLLRKYVNKSISPKRESLVSDEHKSSNWMCFLCENYKPQYWFWEVIELARKVTQTLLVTLLGWESKLTVLLTIGISVSFLILHARYLPMKSTFEQGLQMFSLVAIFINVLVTAMKVPVTDKGTLSIALTLLNVAVIGIIAGEAVLGLIHHLRRTHLLRRVTNFLVRLKTWIVNQI